MSKHTAVAIIGAGPYGLSLAAHLRAEGIEFRIFGHPMQSWRQMPEGMVLKSAGFASNLSDPDHEFPLSRYCAEHAIAYDDNSACVGLETFCDYGLAFKDRFVGGLEQKMVVSLDHDDDYFVLRLDDGALVHVRIVVIAVGIGYFRHLPETFESLPAPFVSHSFDSRDPASFAGRRVAVLGGGASAIDVAAMLSERGAEVELICRREALNFWGPSEAGQPSLWRRIRQPRSGLGPGLQSRLYSDAPLLFHLLPAPLRLAIVRRHLGPASPWRMKERIVGRMPVHCGAGSISARLADAQVEIEWQRGEGEPVSIRVDHVVAATGFQTDIRRLDFLSQPIVSRLATAGRSPALSSRFESSVKGLHFIGPAAAASFGPLMRFAYGARFAATRVTRRLAREAGRQTFATPETTSPAATRQ